MKNLGFDVSSFFVVSALLALIVPSGCAGPLTQGGHYGIVPQPLELVAERSGPFLITEKTAVVYRDDQSRVSANYLLERLRTSSGLKLDVRSSGADEAIVLSVSNESVHFGERDSYYFESRDDKITITGKSERGLFYGVQTLLQLLPAAVYADTLKQNLVLSVPAVRIQDRPSMDKIRGLHVDIARHFRTKSEIFRIIDCMAMHKLNTLHLHLTDDEGWGVELTSYPEFSQRSVHEDGSPKYWTQEEIKEICAYAKSRYIDIIPEIDMPGHMGIVIKAHPELKSPTDVRERGRVIRIDSQGRELVKNILREIDRLFDPEYIHIGCDEINFGSEVIIYSDEEIVEFVDAICTFIKSDLNKIPIVWDDAFVKGWHDQGTVVNWWRYGKVHWWKHFEFTVDEQINQREQPFIFSPAYWVYFDMKNVDGDTGNDWAGSISPAEVYNWDPFADMKGSTAKTREYAHGAIAPTWSETIYTMKDFGERALPRLAAYAERIWRGGKSEAPKILSWPEYRDQVLIPYQLKRYDAMDFYYWSKDEPNKLLQLRNNAKKL